MLILINIKKLIFKKYFAKQLSKRQARYLQNEALAGAFSDKAATPPQKFQKSFTQFTNAEI